MADRVPWEAVLKGKGVQEGFTFFKKEINVQKHPCAERWAGGEEDQPGWTEGFAWNLGNRRAYHLWRETQKDYKYDMKLLCREKIGKTKAQAEFSLATAVKDNQKCFYEHISHKRRSKNNLHPLLDVRGNRVTKDEEKAEVFSAFFASVFNSKTSCSLGVQPLRTGSRMKPP